MAEALYLSYDGMCDPLGASQVLPYLFGLARNGHRITLISFEKPGRGVDERAAVATACAAAGIDWRPLRYHRRPPVLSSLYDVQRMYRLAVRLHRASRFDLVHCRSYIPAAAGLHLKRRFGVPLLFDMRGFWPEEKTEGGRWNLHNPAFRLVYRYFKRLERELLAESDAIVSLTEAGKTELLRRPELRGNADRITVIPCCVDFSHFAPADADARRAARRDLGIADDAAVLAYLGSLGGNYMLGEMLDFFRVFREWHPGARFLFVTREDERSIRAEGARRGIENVEMVVQPASRTEVARLIAAADLGIAFKQPSFSALACSPTKLGEILAMELPIITNSGVGDVEQVVEQTGAGIIVRAFDDDAYRRALDSLDHLSPAMDKWRSGARRWFDLDRGVVSYDAIYGAIASSDVGSAGPVR
jgi:glycosyltransferase involved in cell wall biosynthesis